jgi:hypothetical protein
MRVAHTQQAQRKMGSWVFTGMLVQSSICMLHMNAIGTQFLGLPTAGGNQKKTSKLVCVECTTDPTKRKSTAKRLPDLPPLCNHCLVQSSYCPIKYALLIMIRFGSSGSWMNNNSIIPDGHVLPPIFMKYVIRIHPSTSRNLKA